MGLLELVLIAGMGVAGAVGFFVLRSVLLPMALSTTLPPATSRRAGVLGALAALSALVGLGTGPWFGQLLVPVGESVLISPLVLQGAPTLYGIGVMVFLLVLPPLLALGWWGVARSDAGSVRVAIGGWCGAMMGLVVASRLFPRVPTELVGFGDAVGWLAWVAVGFGLAGMAGGVAVAVGSTAWRAGAVVTLFVPAVAMLIGGVLSPPDVLSQLTVALPILVLWSGGLLLGAPLGRILPAARDTS